MRIYDHNLQSIYVSRTPNGFCGVCSHETFPSSITPETKGRDAFFDHRKCPSCNRGCIVYIFKYLPEWVRETPPLLTPDSVWQFFSANHDKSWEVPFTEVVAWLRKNRPAELRKDFSEEAWNLFLDDFVDFRAKTSGGREVQVYPSSRRKSMKQYDEETEIDVSELKTVKRKMVVS